MNAKTRNYAAKLFVLVLVLAVSISFASCGGPKTLEEYVNSNQETKQEIESAGNGTGLEVSIKGNVVNYTYKYTTTYTDDQVEILKKSLESAMKKSEATFSNIATQLEKETEIDGISIVVEYFNGDGKTIYSHEFK